MDLTPAEYDTLCNKIAHAQDEAEHHARRRHQMARCVAWCIRKAIEANGLTLADCAAAAGLCGSLQAAFMIYLAAAYRMESGLEGAWADTAGDVLVALGELEREETSSP